MHTDVYSYTTIHTHTHTHKHTFIHVHTHAYTHACIHMHTHAQIQFRPYRYINMYKNPSLYVYTFIYIYVHTQTHTYSHKTPFWFSRTHSNIHTYTLTPHAYTHTHTPIPCQFLTRQLLTRWQCMFVWIPPLPISLSSLHYYDMLWHSEARAFPPFFAIV